MMNKLLWLYFPGPLPAAYSEFRLHTHILSPMHLRVIYMPPEMLQERQIEMPRNQHRPLEWPKVDQPKINHARVSQCSPHTRGTSQAGLSVPCIPRKEQATGTHGGRYVILGVLGGQS